MHPVLQQVLDAYGSLLADRPAEWCQRHPRHDERQWSAQELIEHLVLTCRSTTRELEKRLERGHPTRTRRTLLHWLMQRAVLSFGRVPNGVRAPAFTRPDQLHWSATGGAELLESLRREMGRMDARIADCRQRFGTQQVASHFLLGPLRPEQWRRFHGIHIRHHLEQLRRISKAINDPVWVEASPASREGIQRSRVSSST